MLAFTGRVKLELNVEGQPGRCWVPSKHSITCGTGVLSGEQKACNLVFTTHLSIPLSRPQFSLKNVGHPSWFLHISEKYCKKVK